MGSQQQNHPQDGHHHHILPTRVALAIGLSLMVLTVVTVWVAGIDLGQWNFPIAMAVATCKALLVCLFFMGLKYDHRENGLIFFTSFLFLAIFMILTSTDIFFRGDIYVKGQLGTFEAGNFAPAGGSQASKYKTPWVSTPEMVAHGKELFAQQCASCHGVNGGGDGPAASALIPHPRNFLADAGWKNGRKPTEVFRTLKEGLPPSAMASYATLPVDDRWSLVHYVISLGSTKPAADTVADFARVGLDPTKEGGGGAGPVVATIPLDLAVERLVKPESKAVAHAHVFHPRAASASSLASLPGHAVYQQHCLPCHDVMGQGGIRVQSLGVNPIAYVTTASFKDALGTSLASYDSFRRLVVEGLPGRVMPGVGHLNATEMKDLYNYVRTQASRLD